MSDYGVGGGRGWDSAATAADPVGATQRMLAARRRQRRWVGALWALAAIVVGLAALTVALSVHRAGRAPSPTAPPAGGGAGASSSSTTSSLPSGPGPVISSLSPARGAVGQVVVITGSGLVSSDGKVLARFGTVGTTTRCPSSTTCQATVPPPAGGTPKVLVTVTTADGTSNPLPFTYG